MLKRIFQFLICLLSVLQVRAQLVLDEHAGDIFLTDKNSSFGIHTNDASYYWIETKIEKTTSSDFLIECLAPQLKEVKAYVLTSTGDTARSFVTGSDYPFTQRYLHHKNFIFPLNMEPGMYTIRIGVRDIQPDELYFKIRSDHFFTEYAISEYFFLGCYYGILLIVLLYNLFLYMKGALRVHILYVLYIIGCIALSVREDGMAYQYVFPYFPSFNFVFNSYLAKPIFLSTFIVYSVSFLDIKKYVPIVKKILLGLLGVYAFLLLVSIIVPAAVSFLEYIFFSVFILVYVTSFIIAKKGNHFAYYFFAGFSMVMLSVLINLLRSFNIIPSTILTVYSFNYGIILEVIIFSVALADKIRIIQEERAQHKEALIVQLSENDVLQHLLIAELKEKKILQEKVNRELETKVRERTIELQSANEKLATFAKETDRLNSELDRFNYALQKEIKEEKVSRIYNQDVSYVEFLTTYPDDDSCLKVIQQLKWPEGFVCRKCGNAKASEAGVWYRKKCSKCGTIESITANTLFHHLKFPLNKAFYLTYVKFSNLKQTDESLSDLIDLRKPTIWAYRKKVEERMLEKKYAKASNWKDIVLDLPS
ncbi:7TM diverse intracellular signaling domain-containing protein [Cytophaga aurantiaca]|uniref:7TM diverse intracellular signaling domain-containing protein n=1 Tax=Cytophaga aurantiaca TaxID=29530 RepID=UPI00037E995C|nr:7TM diverse intracellular signaling domain-containing protein [Cytophaga aurantiaca]